MKKQFGFAVAILCAVAAMCGCSESDDSDGGCTAGTRKCEGSTLQVCLANGSWQVSNCSAGCDANGQQCAAPAQVCVANMQTCSSDGQSIMICNAAGTSQDPYPCTNGHCDASTGMARCVANSTETEVECQSGQIKCSDDNSGTMSCGLNNKWGTVNPCLSGKKCSGGQCIDTLECTAGSVKCSLDLTSTITCGTDGKWGAAVACPTGQTCDSTKLACETPSTTGCVMGEKKCSDDGNSTVTCMRGRWGLPISCPVNTKCESGSCIETGTTTCTPGSVRCSTSPVGTQTCGVNGTWGSVVACSDGQVCDPTLLKCVSSCTSGEKSCSGYKDQALLCNTSGTWEVSKTCVAGEEVCIDGACKKKECNPNEDFCMDSAIYKCTEDGMKGEKVQKCDKGCKGDGTCADCKAKEKQCSATGVFSVCVDGEWQAQADCGTKDNCKDSTFLGIGDYGCKCDEDTTKCTQDGKGVLVCTEKEVAGVEFLLWENSFTCDTQCRNGTCDCKDGDRRCGTYKKKDTVEICNEGEWEVVDNCEKSEVCDKDLSACIAEDAVCETSSSNECLASNLVTCPNGFYDIKESCQYFCVDSWYASPKCKNECTGTSACSADYTKFTDCKTSKITRCPEGQRCVETKGWKNSTRVAACENKVCDEFAITCNGNKIQICKDNQLVEIANCEDSNAICKNGACVKPE